MVTLELKVRLIFDQDPTDLDHIESAIYDAVRKWEDEGLITGPKEQAVMIGVDIVEVQ